VPSVWALRVDPIHCPAIARELECGARVTVGHLRSHPSDRARPLDCIALLLLRSGEPMLLPAQDVALERSDAVLFAGTAEAQRLQLLIASNSKVCDYVRLGIEAPDGWIWRVLARVRTGAAAAGR
jgi:hypothetical protein